MERVCQPLANSNPESNGPITLYCTLMWPLGVSPSQFKQDLSAALASPLSQHRVCRVACDLPSQAHSTHTQTALSSKSCVVIASALASLTHPHYPRTNAAPSLDAHISRASPAPLFSRLCIVISIPHKQRLFPTLPSPSCLQRLPFFAFARAVLSHASSASSRRSPCHGRDAPRLSAAHRKSLPSTLTSLGRLQCQFLKTRTLSRPLYLLRFQL